MKTFIEFLHMGGYGPYVWSAYGLTLAVLAWNIFPVLGAERRRLSQLKRRAHRKETGS